MMVPEEINTLVQTAKLDWPFQVVHMQADDIFDLQKMAHEQRNTDKMNISTITAKKVTQTSLAKICMLTKRTYSNTEEWMEMHLGKKRVKLSRDIPTNLPLVKTVGVIKQDKLDDLEKTIEFLEPKYRSFNKNYFIIIAH